MSRSYEDPEWMEATRALIAPVLHRLVTRSGEKIAYIEKTAINGKTLKAHNSGSISTTKLAQLLDHFNVSWTVFGTMMDKAQQGLEGRELDLENGQEAEDDEGLMLAKSLLETVTNRVRAEAEAKALDDLNAAIQKMQAER